MDEIIKVNGLVKEIKGFEILKNISFSVSRGEIFGLLGPNGSGKTTTIRVLLNILQPTAGSVEVLGVDVMSEEYTAKRNCIGFMLENLGLIPHFNSWKNLEFFDRIYNPGSSEADRGRRLHDLLDFVGLLDSTDKPINSFSHGMKRRLVLARALINDPEVLILDEPTLGLDPEARKLFRDMIFELKKDGKTIFLSSHDLDEVQRISTKIAMLEGGTILGCDSYAALSAKFGNQSIRVRVDKVGDWINDLKAIVDDLQVEDDELIITGGNQAEILNFLVSRSVKIIEMGSAKNLEDIYLDMVKSEPERRQELINAMNEGRRRF